MARIVIDKDGNKRYFNNLGQLHRDDGPAYISIDGTNTWYFNGQWFIYNSRNGRNECYVNENRYKHTSACGVKYLVENGSVVWPEL